MLVLRIESCRLLRRAPGRVAEEREDRVVELQVPRAEAVFGGLLADGLFLEYDDERSGGFEPLRFVRDGTTVVLGLVTTKTPALEDKDALKRRVEEASKYVDIDRLCLSPQCGFASTVEGNALTIDEERAKLALVVETAEEIWG